MAKKTYHITLIHRYNNSTNVMAMMTREDVNFSNSIKCNQFDDGSLNYKIQEQVSTVKRTPKGQRWNGHSFKIATTESGKSYRVFSDHSCVLI